ncbi:MAG: PadR family transcriptional regulator [Chloroflexi bacterium]|nr:MAG: hypothetical protein CUN54_08380 [Phototrophicales bacterium]RMF80903.1 MAG: PadR family transcriptional regulator [Chloroflexota bacterium]
MAHQLSRDLTTLEYVVLGLIGIKPQSGYTIINFFEEGAFRWSASPGSIYPILKRLEKQDIIAGELEMIHETRPRKLYTLTSLGEALLDEWLKQPPAVMPLYEERDIALWKFLFAESRLTREEILHWLDAYQEQIEAYEVSRKIFQAATEAATEEFNLAPSIHSLLVTEAIIMEINTQRTWIQMARHRLSGTLDDSNNNIES